MKRFDEADRRVRIPLFPLYSELRRLLPVWDGKPRARITQLQATINSLRGSPQEPVDWTDPDHWIPDRLDGTDRELAEAVWLGSAKRVNPRHVYGHWLLACKYVLLEEDDRATMRLSSRGQDFVERPRGDAEVLLDEGEGVLHLLTIVGDKGPARFGDFVEAWDDYLKRRSRFSKESVVRDSLRRRLNNLIDRQLVSRSGLLYSLTDEGLAYLERVGELESKENRDGQQLRKLVKGQTAQVREKIADLLFEMDPIDFEHLVKRLLEAMEYQNVEVTSPAGDGGVDVVADIELGITSVREVVQAKRVRRTVQRHVLDALRGSLHRFDAVRGTIITTGRFTRGTQDAAFERGAAPITLIDGEKLVDLLIEHGIGVRKRTIDLLEMAAEDFSSEEAAAEGED